MVTRRKMRVIEWVREEDLPPRKNWTVINGQTRKPRPLHPMAKLAKELKMGEDDWALVDVVPQAKAKKEADRLRRYGKKYGFRVIQRQTRDMTHTRLFAKAV